jgi:SAM-dependent methyltransferase
MTPIKSYGGHFAARSVAQNYVHRPAYAPEVFATLASLMPSTQRAILDAGCGPGKIALGMTRAASRIDAVDPAAEMLEIGRSLAGGGDPKIDWICATLEEAPLSPPYGLIVCGVSFHWMDADLALTRFAQVLAPGGHFALVSGDAPADPPWKQDEDAIFSDFITRLQGKPPVFPPSTQDALQRPLLEHRRFRRLGARITVPHPVRQSVADYLACQHSRATWSVEFMGPAMSAEFDARLGALLASHAPDGMLDYVVQTRVEWGLPLP